MNKILVSQYVTQEFHAVEAIKTLRTNLMFSGSSIRSVALTSFSASEGKSTLSFQLAASLAQAGKRVLLMDTDLRRSMFQTRLKIKEKLDGLSHYLSGMSNANELIHETDVPGFYMMFAGARVPNSSELLGSESFSKLILALEDVFDYVIIDAAPLGQVIDCAVISPAIDGVVMVVDVTNNSYKLERRIKAQLEKSGAKILGVVLNRVDFKERRGYYGRGYKYGYKYSYKYGYGYGYGEQTN